jgi:hypothetical protein
MTAGFFSSLLWDLHVVSPEDGEISCGTVCLLRLKSLVYEPLLEIPHVGRICNSLTLAVTIMLNTSPLLCLCAPSQVQ